MMCGRFSIAVRIGNLAERFGVSEPPGIFLPRFNIAPGEEVPVITGSARMSMMRWGLIPSWTTGEKITLAPINARAEGITEKKLFRALLSKGRCIIPATGFYEWKKSGNRKSPMYFRMKSQEVFGMAGLCDSWEAPEGGIVWSFTIITTQPNSLVLPIHNRMPVLLRRRYENQWLDHASDMDEGLATMLTPYPPEEMEMYPVTKKVNTPSFKSEPTVLEEIHENSNDLVTWDTR